MLLWTILKVALGSLTANKLRTLLAMLGIIIGVGAVISMLAIGTGFRNQMLSRFTAMGTNLLIVRAGAARRGGVRSASSMESLKLDDAAAILDTVDGLEAVVPVTAKRAQVKYYNRNSNTTVTGTAGVYLSVRNFKIEKGRSFSEMEEDESACVAVLGADLAQTLFDQKDPLEETIRIGNVNFRVIGLLKAKGDQGWSNPDDMAVIPYSTAMKRIFGQEFLNEIDLKAREKVNLTQVQDDVTALLRKRHRLRADAEDDFHVRNQAEMIEMAGDMASMLTIFLGGIAGISLLVGGIGVMNIMLVTVTERTREIGVRKAVGARNRDILRQFLLEAVLLSGLGGFFGIAVGFAGAAAARYFSPLPAEVELFSILLSLGVSCAVGVFFGWYPARRAAALNPIDALRYE